MILCLRRDDLCLTRQLSLLCYCLYFQPYFLHLLPFRLLYIMQEKKADTEEKALITKNDYQKTILIFSIINFIASFVAMAVPNITSSGDNNHISIAQFTYLSLILAILAAGVVEFFIAKSTIFQRFSCSKTDKTKRAAVFAAICAPYYIFIVSSPIVLFIIAVSLYPC